MTEPSQAQVAPGDRAAALEALGAADAARSRVARSLEYPRGYLASIALQAALMTMGIGGGAFVDGIPSGARALAWVSFAASLLLAGVNIPWFERHNGVRLRSQRFVRWPSALYLLPILALILLAANRVNVTGAWWAGIAAAPLVAGCVALYYRAWLRDYHRDQGSGVA